MSGAILRFERTARPAGWTNQELAELQRVGQLLANAGLPVASEQGLSDEGDPWFIFLRTDTEEVVAHLARIDGWYVAVAAGEVAPTWGTSFRGIADTLISRQPLAMPKGPGNDLFTHPVAILAAFVAMALVQANPSSAEQVRVQPDGGGGASGGPPVTSLPGRDASNHAGKHVNPASDSTGVSYALAAVTSALALAIEAEPALAADREGPDRSRIAWDVGAETVARGSASDAAAATPPPAPEALRRGSDEAALDKNGLDAAIPFGRLLEGQMAASTVPVEHLLGNPEQTDAITPVSKLETTWVEEGNQNVEAPAAHKHGPDAFSLFGPPVNLAQSPATESKPAESVDRQDVAADSGHDDATADGQVENEAAWTYLNLPDLVRDLGPTSVDTPAERATPTSAADAKRADSEFENSDGEGARKPASNGSEAETALPLRDTDGDGHIDLTEAADRVIYDGGHLSVEGFELGRDRLIVEDGEGLTAVAVDQTSSGDFKLVFEHDVHSVTFIGLGLSDFEAL